jgi:hypothetical protein
MTKNNRKHDNMYYGDLPSNYLPNLGKEIVKKRIKDSGEMLGPSDIVNSAGGSYVIKEKEMETALKNIYKEIGID